MTQARPLGITIFAILAAVAGVFGFLGGAALLGIGSVAGAAGFLVGGIAAFFGLLILAVALLELALAYGLWTIQPWAWTLGIGLEAVSIVLELIRFAGGRSNAFSFLVTLVIAGAIIWYLTQPSIRTLFGRG
jgi:hypothetical protein